MFEFIEQDIDIRVESIKQTYDKFCLVGKIEKNEYLKKLLFNESKRRRLKALMSFLMISLNTLPKQLQIGRLKQPLMFIDVKKIEKNFNDNINNALVIDLFDSNYSSPDMIEEMMNINNDYLLFNYYDEFLVLDKQLNAVKYVCAGDDDHKISLSNIAAFVNDEDKPYFYAHDNLEDNLYIVNKFKFKIYFKFMLKKHLIHLRWCDNKFYGLDNVEKRVYSFQILTPVGVNEGVYEWANGDIETKVHLGIDYDNFNSNGLFSIRELANYGFNTPLRRNIVNFQVNNDYLCLCDHRNVYLFRNSNNSDLIYKENLNGISSAYILNNYLFVHELDSFCFLCLNLKHNKLESIFKLKSENLFTSISTAITIFSDFLVILRPVSRQILCLKAN